MAGIKMRKNERLVFEDPQIVQDLSYDLSQDSIEDWYRRKFEAYKATQAAKKAK